MVREVVCSASSLACRAIIGRVLNRLVSNHCLSADCKLWATTFRLIPVLHGQTLLLEELSLEVCPAYTPRPRAIQPWSVIREWPICLLPIWKAERTRKSLSSRSSFSTYPIVLSCQPTRTNISNQHGRLPIIPSLTTIWIQLLSGTCIATPAIRTTCCWARCLRL